MKNMLFYNYNLSPDNLTNLENGDYSFFIDYDKYIVKEIKRPEEDVKEIANIVKNYPKQFHDMFYNRFNSLFSKYENKNYILLKLCSPEQIEIDLKDILDNEKVYETKSSILNRTDWSELWSSKVDYLEYQVSELATPHPIVRKSFSYYVGLAENAIMYFNMLSPKNVKTYITHRRIDSPSFTKDFYNPLNLVIDYRVRDISSYIKNNFFNGHDMLAEVDMLIKKNILSPLEYNLLFCRLLYPGYYFDSIYKIFEKNLDEEYILKYIDLANDYEEFLNEVYKKFSLKSSMIKIDWLIKKES